MPYNGERPLSVSVSMRRLAELCRVTRRLYFSTHNINLIPNLVK